MSVALKQESEYDQALLWIVLFLFGIGLVMVYSASIAVADARKGFPAYYLVRQSAYILTGAAAGYAAFHVPMRIWQKYAPYIFMLMAFMLLLVLVPGIGRAANGSTRWIPLGFAHFQPSEFMKLCVVLYAADYTVRKAAYMNNLSKGFTPMLFVILFTGMLLLREPDFGAFAVITVITMAALFLGGMNGRLFTALLVLAAVGFTLLVLSKAYRMDRVVGFMNPWADPQGKGYQLSHALVAIGRGEWLGVGLGASVEKLLYLPEAQSDFLFAVIGEELGFVGIAVVIGLFAAFVIRSFMIGRTAASMEKYFSALVAQGVGVWIGVQAIVNLGVNMGVLPTKGLTLPMLSYGGSGIVANCLALAVLFRVDYENRQLMKGRAF